MSKQVSKPGISVRGNHHTTTRNHMPYGITQCYLPPDSGDFPFLPQSKVVLDIATAEGCTAELTQVSSLVSPVQSRQQSVNQLIVHSTSNNN